ncbi:MAG TPA: hypothetical protein ENK48_04395 [Gammaproteobacteria bacterium]|nr:hypothetical protein [Gammaproteobacteria bacterium]
MNHVKTRHILTVGGMLGMLLAASAPWAQGWVDRTHLNGFLSARYNITNEGQSWLGSLDSDGIDDDGSFYGTKLGLNISSDLSDRISVMTQLFSASQEETFKVHVDWAFGAFRLNDSFQLRAGKIKYPVGIVNEYVEVGVTYPWIQAPVAIYSEDQAGPQATRESYNGVSLLWDATTDNWTWGLDFFGGEVDLENMKVKKMAGVTARADWDDTVLFQASYYQGDMKTDPSMSGMMLAMNNKRHSALVGGIKVDWNDWIAYAEAAQVKMDFKMMGKSVGDSDSWYATLGHRFGRWLPHVTYQDWSRDNGDGHQITTLGLNCNLSSKVVVKAEGSRIETDGKGLFEDRPAGDSTRMFSVAVDMVF